MKKSYTDVIFQNVKLYIEGVQVPFSSISITSGIGGLPSANITVPAQAGLMDIARWYSPKVHIFYSDRLNDYDQEDEDDVKRQDKLLFSGLISQVAYQKSKNVGAYINISFACTHRYSLVNEMLIDYTGWLSGDALDPNPSEAAVKADTPNSQASLITALAGITRKHKSDGTNEEKEITLNNPEGKVTTLPQRYEPYFNSMVGMPSVMMNFWNQMKRSAFNRQLREGDKYYSEAFIKMYKPLLEDGLMFFDRVAGHYPIEGLVHDDMNRVEPCPETPNRREKILIPPMNQMFLASSVQAQMTLSNLGSYMQNSGETTTIYGIFSQFYGAIDYEIITLASPAEVPVRGDMEFTQDEKKEFAATSKDNSILTTEETHAVDTIVKPKIPFYFSPTCNVLFPGMYHSLSVMYDEMNIPTRINVKNVEGPTDSGTRTNFRAPHSVREAIARKASGYNSDRDYSLQSTIGPSYGAIGQYEQGRGIKLESTQMPRWLSMFSQSTYGANAPITDQSPDAKKEANRVDAMAQLAKGWARRYPGDQKKTLNPYTTAGSDISAHHRIIFTSADYYYTQVFARSKMGQVECPFNPFLVPGYPMDILEANPAYPSFHAMCTSVTHTFTAESCGTSVQFTAAMTYSELANYYIPFVNPMMQVALGLAENPTLIGQEEGGKAKTTADEFYRYTLGVPGVSPDELVDFNSFALKPKRMADADGKWVEGSGSSVPGSNGGELNPMLTYEGNLSLTQRPIENRSDIETRFVIDFIDMDQSNYNPTVMKYKNKNLDESQKFEIGQSQFLTYNTYFGTPVVTEAVVDGKTVFANRVGNDSPATDLTTANRIGQ